MAASALEAGSQLNSPPDSTGNKESPPAAHKHDVSDSELSDIEDPDEDIGDVEPDHYADDGRVPVFKPTTEQFRSFTRYVSLAIRNQLHCIELMGTTTDEKDKSIWHEIWHC